ncbi:hypothetical protein Q1J41_26505, partial [Pseudomonas orientalis]
THGFKPAFGQRGLTGRLRSKADQDQKRLAAHRGYGGARLLCVGASLLAKNSQAPRLFRKHALSLKFFANKLAPTSGGVRLTDWH